MGEFRGLIIAVLLAGLFTFAIINFGIFLAVSHGSGTIMENEIINRTYTRLQSDLGDVQGKTEVQRESWFKNIPVVGEISVILETIVSVGKGMTEVVRGMFSLLAELVSVTIGIGEESAKVVVGVFTAIMLLSLILLAWSVYRSGK